MMTRLLLLILVSASLAVDARAVPDDTTRAEVEISVLPRVDKFYSPTRGFGPAVDVTVRNFGWAGSELFVSAETLTRHGDYQAFLFTDDPYDAALYGGFGVGYTGTRAYRFFGQGPRSHVDDEIGLTARRTAVEARLGWRPVETVPVVLQPALRLSHANMRRFEELEQGALDRMNPASVESLLRSIENPSTGIEAEAGVILDLFDDARYPRRGAMLQLVGRLYRGLDDDPFHYRQGSAIAHGVLPISGRRTALEGRVLLTLTRPIGDRPIPFYALAEVGGGLVGGFSRHRLVGNDVLAASAGVRFPVLTLFGFGADGFVAAHMVNTYDDIFAQFEPRVSFERSLDRTGERAPLRPAATIGGTIVNRRSGRPVIGGQIGLSPEGVELATLNFVVDLRTREPRVR